MCPGLQRPVSFWLSQQRKRTIYSCFHFAGLFSGPFTSFSHQPFGHGYVVILRSGYRKGDRRRINSQYTFPLRLAEKQTSIWEEVKALVKVSRPKALVPRRIHRDRRLFLSVSTEERWFFLSVSREDRQLFLSVSTKARPLFHT